MYELLMPTAARNRPLARGDAIRVHTEVPPFRRAQHQGRVHEVGGADISFLVKLHHELVCLLFFGTVCIKN